jgi:two-component system, LytTR family, sensor kinase
VKKSIIVLLHIGFWLCYLILIMVILGTLFGNDGAVSEKRVANAFNILIYFALIPSAISFYLFYFYLFSKFIQPQRFLLASIYGLLIAFGAAIIGYTLLQLIVISDTDDCIKNENTGTLVAMTLFMTFIALVCGIIALVIRGFVTWFEEVKLKNELTIKNRETELALVKSQLDPHFLFNTINNIDVLILKNADQASDYLNKLSDIMRFMLFETKTDEILLTKEMEYIQKYIELQKIRTANQSYVHFEVIGSPNKCLIAPMVFIPFIENAFKHTNNKKIENAIRIQIIINTTNIQLLCENKFDPHRKLQQENNGLGNELIKKRLQLLYPDKHTLEVNNQGELYSVHLSIEHG